MKPELITLCMNNFYENLFCNQHVKYIHFFLCFSGIFICFFQNQLLKKSYMGKRRKPFCLNLQKLLEDDIISYNVLVVLDKCKLFKKPKNYTK